MIARGAHGLRGANGVLVLILPSRSAQTQTGGIYGLYVEGVVTSAAEGDVSLRIFLDPDGDGPLPFALADDVRITVQDISVTWEGWSANEPVDGNPGPGGGRRIFPDLISPTDLFGASRRRLYVNVSVSPTPRVGTIVYLQSFDVDDPSPDENFVLDPNDAGGATLGLFPGHDNRGEDPGKRGSFAVPGGVATHVASIATDSMGRAKVAFEVTMQPGDNFRIAAALSPAELEQLTSGAPDEHLGGTLVPPGSTHPALCPTIALGEMLTVWRRLWIERDVMTGVTAGSQAITIKSVAPSVAQPGMGGINDVITIDGLLNDGEDAFEGGTITIPAFGNKSVRVYLNSANTFSDDTINVPAGSFTPGELAIIAAGPVAATITDDDVVPAGGTHHAPDGGTLLMFAFGEAYILPVYVDPGVGSWNITGTIPFSAHSDDDFDAPKAAKDLYSSEAFWTVQVVGAHQNQPENDGDPDADPGPLASGVPIPTQDLQVDWGVSTKGSGRADNTSLIFLETIRDIGRAQGMIEAAVVTHEIGHTAGYENPHRSTGLMRDANFGNETSFDIESLLLFRETILW